MTRLRFNSKANSPVGIGGKIFGTLFFLAFFLGGLFFLVMIGLEVWPRVASYTWKEAECQITVSEAQTAPSRGSKPHRFKAQFQYIWEGEYHTSESPFVKEKSFDSSSDVQLLIAQDAVDSKSVCYVNPRDPTRAILVREPAWFALFSLIPLVLIAVGGVGVYAIWRVKLVDPKTGELSGPMSDRAKPGAGKGSLALLFAECRRAVYRRGKQHPEQRMSEQ
jgi:hypothetical protein